MEIRYGLAVDVELTPATGTSEREAAIRTLRRNRTRRRRCTLGADEVSDTRDFVDRCRPMGVAPHIAMRESWWADGDRARLQTTPGYQVSRLRRKRVEEIFSWAKPVGWGRKLRYLGVERNWLGPGLTAAAFNLVRMSNLVSVST